MRYLSVVSKLGTVDGGQHAPHFGEAERTTSMEAKQYPAVDRVSNIRYFSHLKKGNLKNINISQSVNYI